MLISGWGCSSPQAGGVWPHCLLLHSPDHPAFSNSPSNVASRFFPLVLVLGLATLSALTRGSIHHCLSISLLDFL